MAEVRGSKQYPEVYGVVYFEKSAWGVLVTAQIYGLPAQEGEESGFFGFHIHEGSSCTESGEAPFSDAGGHYNPKNKPHPFHAGDLPPLLSNYGYAYMTVLTNRFTLEEIVGKTILIHALPDDFKSQPAGNAGSRIACGQIYSYKNPV